MSIKKNNLFVPVLNSKFHSIENLQQLTISGQNIIVNQFHAWRDSFDTVFSAYAFQVIVNNKVVSVLECKEENQVVSMPDVEGEVMLDILVENRGRVNYADYKSEALDDQRKGLTSTWILFDLSPRVWSDSPKLSHVVLRVSSEQNPRNNKILTADTNLFFTCRTTQACATEWYWLARLDDIPTGVQAKLFRNVWVVFSAILSFTHFCSSFRVHPAKVHFFCFSGSWNPIWQPPLCSVLHLVANVWTMASCSRFMHTARAALISTLVLCLETLKKSRQMIPLTEQNHAQKMTLGFFSFLRMSECDLWSEKAEIGPRLSRFHVHIGDTDPKDTYLNMKVNWLRK